jgi:hypothetical protein
MTNLTIIILFILVIFVFSNNKTLSNNLLSNKILQYTFLILIIYYAYSNFNTETLIILLVVSIMFIILYNKNTLNITHNNTNIYNNLLKQFNKAKFVVENFNNIEEENYTNSEYQGEDETYNDDFIVENIEPTTQPHTKPNIESQEKELSELFSNLNSFLDK